MSFLKLKALKIEQPLASFYITKIKASQLLEVSFSEELEYIDDNGELKGNQRPKDEKRLQSIARYIDSVEMSFPNSIIIAANYDKLTGQIIDNETDRWLVKKTDADIYEIEIPSNRKLASIIDGQHRLNAFEYVSNQERKEIELVCAIFFDLSNSYQAFLFATINGNQKKVDKSLALEQFGFNVDDEPSTSWTPEKFAVFYCRKLNFKESALKGKIKVAPKFEGDVLTNINRANFIVSTATIVDGILSLISSNPKRDRVEMGQTSIFKGRSRKMLKDFRDSTPLRKLYLNNEDEKIYEIVKEYFNKVDAILWKDIKGNSYIIKTVGIQALFDLLKKILETEGIGFTDYGIYLKKVEKVDFSDNYFQASGVGKSRIKRVLFVANNLMSINEIKDDGERTDIERLIIS